MCVCVCVCVCVRAWGRSFLSRSTGESTRWLERLGAKIKNKSRRSAMAKQSSVRPKVWMAWTGVEEDENEAREEDGDEGGGGRGEGDER